MRVWTFFAVSVVFGSTWLAFVGISVVAPTVSVVAESLSAAPQLLSLSYSTYFAATALVLLMSGWIASRFSPRAIAMSGLVVVAAAATGCAAAPSIAFFIFARTLWGAGNALFISAVLSLFASALRAPRARGSAFYEAALGLGLATGPLLAAALGQASWRVPYGFVAALSAAAAVALLVLPRAWHRPARTVTVWMSLGALKDRRLALVSIFAALYNVGFFTVITVSPLALKIPPIEMALVFCAWGLVLALTSALVARPLMRRIGGPTRLLPPSLALFAVSLIGLASALLLHTQPLVAAGAIVLSGFCSGLVNGALTSSVLTLTHLEPTAALASYNFVRWTAGGLAPFAALLISVWTGGYGVTFVCTALLALFAATVRATIR